MCLAIPAQVIEIEGSRGKIEFGGVKRPVNLSLLEEVSCGDYVIVHAGFAIQKLDEEEALKTLELLREICELNTE